MENSLVTYGFNKDREGIEQLGSVIAVVYNRGQKCWEGNFILQIPPSPFSISDFPGEKNGDFFLPEEL